MGTWDAGPFDNDTAADWCGHLRDTEAAKRPDLLRGAVNDVVENTDDYLDSYYAERVVAAAAVMASQLPGGEPINSAYASGDLASEIPGDLPALALRALDRITGDESEWRELWEETDSYPAVLAGLDAIRVPLTRAANGA
ncbi:MAG: DUF4259 domain-containing protein [Actinoplanes sp.]